MGGFHIFPFMGHPIPKGGMTVNRKQTLLLRTGLFLIGGFGYVLLELLWRGRSHWSMFAVGGLCFRLIGGIGERLRRVSWPVRGAACAAAVTAVEFISGCVVNLWWGLGVWDYSRMRYHLKGQVCLTYSLLWMLLSLAVCPFYALCRRLLCQRLSAG